ncbi:MAG TPA: ABC transporter substrate-binding protein [Roseateles sp.]
MNFAQEKQGASRFTGFGVVVLIHVVAIWALASGLAKDIVKKVTGPIETKVIEEQVKPPPPPEKVVPPPPDIKAPPPPFVPPPEFQVTAPAPPAPPIQSTQVAPPATDTVRPQPAPVPAAPPAPPKAAGPKTAAMVCTKMGKPEMPSVNWSGEALFKATATVKAGRVVDVTFTSLRGGVDRKAQRALTQAIQATLFETYECPGDHVFEQEFQFKIE